MLLMMAALLAADAGSEPAPPHNYLKGAQMRRPCGVPDDAGEIVVCARDPETDRLHDPDRGELQHAPPKAEVALGGGATLGIGLKETALSAANRKAAPNEPIKLYGSRPMLTLRIPLPTVH